MVGNYHSLLFSYEIVHGGEGYPTKEARRNRPLRVNLKTPKVPNVATIVYFE